MSDEENKPAKIISLKTRREMPEEEVAVIEQGLPPETEAPKVDQDTVDIVHSFHAACAEGKYSGALVIGWDPNLRCFFSDLVLPRDDHNDISAAKWIGYLEGVKMSLLAIMNQDIIVDMGEEE